MTLHVADIHIRLAFVTYDWLINIDEELHWYHDIHQGRKLNAAVLLYVLNRYPMIIKLVLQLRTMFSMSDMVRLPCQ